MSVIVKGMDFPKSCFACEFNTDDEVNFLCAATAKVTDEFYTKRTRPEWCPLEEMKYRFEGGSELFEAICSEGYEIRFRTPDKEKYLAVQAECWRQIDAKQKQSRKRG